jgi:transposase-like protein
MSKLTREQKIEIYAKRKCGETVISLSRQYHVELENIKYLIRLIDLPGFSVLNTGKSNYYSRDLKLQMITKVLVNSQSIQSTDIEFGLPSKSILSQWITKYKYLEEKNIYLEAENESKKITSRSSKSEESTTKEKVNVVSELRQTYPIKILLHISQIKKSTYYYTLSKQDKDVKNDLIMNTIITIFYDHKKRYGYRRITLELRNRGYQVNHKIVQRLMKVMGLFSNVPKAKYKSYKGVILIPW